jgi:hypothetical protein
MRMTYPDVTKADPRGATPKQQFEFKPLKPGKWNHRMTKVEQAPSLIAGKLVKAPGGQ